MNLILLLISLVFAALVVQGSDETPCIALQDCIEPPVDHSSSSSPASALSTAIPTSSSTVKTTMPPTSAPSPTTSGDATVQSAITPYLSGCNAQQASMLSEAWAEASTLAVAAYQWSPPGYIFNGAYQDAMDLYMGTDSRNDWTFLGGGKSLSEFFKQPCSARLILKSDRLPLPPSLRNC